MGWKMGKVGSDFILISVKKRQKQWEDYWEVLGIRMVPNANVNKAKSKEIFFFFKHKEIILETERLRYMVSGRWENKQEIEIIEK